MKTAMIDLKQLHHISLVTQNVAASKRFYCDILGMEDAPRPANFTFEGAWFRSGAYEIHLIGWADATQYFGDPPNGHKPDGDITYARHFCFRVASMADALRTLHEHDYPIAWGPRPRGDGATQLYLYDPDGHFVELVEIPWMD